MKPSETLTKNRMELPFLISDITPRSSRALVVASGYHANGATGIQAVEVATADPQAVFPLYTALFSGVQKQTDNTRLQFHLKNSSLTVREEKEIGKSGPVHIMLKKGANMMISIEDLIG